jgi:hypothetical protein
MAEINNNNNNNNQDRLYFVLADNFHKEITFIGRSLEDAKNAHAFLYHDWMFNHGNYACTCKIYHTAALFTTDQLVYEYKYTNAADFGQMPAIRNNQTLQNKLMKYDTADDLVGMILLYCHNDCSARNSNKGINNCMGLFYTTGELLDHHGNCPYLNDSNQCDCHAAVVRMNTLFGHEHFRKIGDSDIAKVSLIHANDDIDQNKALEEDYGMYLTATKRYPATKCKLMKDMSDNY